MAQKYYATPDQIRRIKAAIKRHNMALAWESIAARPALIEDFLRKAEEEK